MQSLLSLLGVMLLAATGALGQQHSSVNPLSQLGISFGASAADVIRACERAGLVIDRVDSGAGCPEEHFSIRASGAVYLGHPATLFLGGGASRPKEDAAVGLRSVTTILESDSPSSLRNAMNRCLDTLVWTYGASTYRRTRPENIKMIGYAEEHCWRKQIRPESDNLQISVEASLETAVEGRYLVKVQFARLDQ